jgi:zinc/manganese transport system substrate-binding protein
MFNRRNLLLLAGLAAVIATDPALAQDKPQAKAQDKSQDKIKVVATFSILADLVRNVGGDRVEVASLVGPNGDAHVFSPTPADAKTVGTARVVFVNGLGFEGWMTRLIRASGTKAPTVVATKGVKPRRTGDKHAGHKHDHGHSHGSTDPHAWQSIANVKIYVANIRDGLSKADPAGKEAYAANAAAYIAKLDALEREVREAVAKIPADRRRIVTTHDAFGYFSDAYGIEFISPGISTESSPSAKEIASLIARIRKQKIPAVFLENVTDPRLMQQIAKETGAKVGGALYSDALSEPSGPAGTYIDMMRSNIRELSNALTS